MGEPAVGDRILVYLALRSADIVVVIVVFSPPPLPARAMAVPMAVRPHQRRGGSHQATGRRVLAEEDVPVLSFRDSADSEVGRGFWTCVLQVCLLSSASYRNRLNREKNGSPFSFLFHFLPKWVLRRAVDLDFFVQLYSIWLVLIPGFTWYMTILRRLGGFIQVKLIRPYILCIFHPYLHLMFNLIWGWGVVS